MRELPQTLNLDRFGKEILREGFTLHKRFDRCVKALSRLRDGFTLHKRFDRCSKALRSLSLDQALSQVQAI